MANEKDSGISVYFHCRDCVSESTTMKISAEDYQQNTFGMNEDGDLIIFCRRHKKHVAIFPSVIDTDKYKCECEICKFRRMNS